MRFLQRERRRGRDGIIAGLCSFFFCCFFVLSLFFFVSPVLYNISLFLSLLLSRSCYYFTSFSIFFLSILSCSPLSFFPFLTLFVVLLFFSLSSSSSSSSFRALHAEKFNQHLLTLQEKESNNNNNNNNNNNSNNNNNEFSLREAETDSGDWLFFVGHRPDALGFSLSYLFIILLLLL